MMRYLLIPALLAGTLAVSTPAEAQRRPAPVTQGITSSDMAITADELRSANAQIGARLTGLEADRASLSGKVETLEFLLSQSRDQINEMQDDDAAIDAMIGRLERRLKTQDAQIKTLVARLDAIEASTVETASAPDTDLLVSSEEAFEMNEEAGEEIIVAAAVPNRTEGSSGPTRIVRRTVPAGETARSSTITVTGSRVVQAENNRPTGSLGTISASALPGEAGPLFATAKSRLLQFDYVGAEAAFRSFLEQFSDDPQAGEAQYWLAEVLYQQDAYSESGQAYTHMIRQYPDDPRAPEALAKLARSMRLVGDTDKACNALNILPQRYPEASGVTKNLAAGERVRSGCDS